MGTESTTPGWFASGTSQCASIPTATTTPTANIQTTKTMVITIIQTALTLEGLQITPELPALETTVRRQRSKGLL